MLKKKEQKESGMDTQEEGPWFHSKECYDKHVAGNPNIKVAMVNAARNVKEEMMDDIKDGKEIITVARTAAFEIWDNKETQQFMIQCYSNSAAIWLDYELFEELKDAIKQMEDYAWERVKMEDEKEQENSGVN